ncbi:MAG TPA: 50S ribosomal protein L20 [Spirochaetota bacterium]|nr:50S ribosomal protein L20 [Spirochaetota bacterium]
MPRSKNIQAQKKRARKIFKQTKGFYGRKKNTYKLAKQSALRANMFAFAHRRKKKARFRQLWNIRIAAALEPYGFSYSDFIGALKKHNILLNRKSLAFLAAKDNKAFATVVNAVKASQ